MFLTAASHLKADKAAWSRSKRSISIWNNFTGSNSSE